MRIEIKAHNKRNCVVICIAYDRVLTSVCLCVCPPVCTIKLKSERSINFKLTHVAVYKNSSDEFNIAHCLIKVKVMVRL